jgi:diaminohydroxyphosphoribosylaminopyrimidine deaminase / 5-amino-6-(5-phosphoribosylamino)uracil reductase
MPDPSSTDRRWMELAIELSRLCPPSESAYSVGAVIVDGDGDGDGRELARGYSREDDPHVHAEESALGKLGTLPDGDPRRADGGLRRADSGLRRADGDLRRADGDLRRADSGLRRADGDLRLQGATLYSTLEPCSQRLSRPRTCTDLILAAGIGRVVIAWREPSLFVADCRGSELLTEAGVTVVELADLARQARAVNAHLRLGQ